MVQVYEDPGTGQSGGKQAGIGNAFVKGVAGSLGILAALAIDYVQKHDSSALVNATKIINMAALTQFHTSAPPYIYLAALLIAGFAMVFVFEPTSTRNAFYAGAGVLGFLATFSPIAAQTLQIPSAAELPTLDSILQATQGTPDATAPAAPAPAAPGGTPVPASGTNGFGDTGIATMSRQAQRAVGDNGEMVVAQAETIPLNIVIQLPGAPSNNQAIRVSVHEDATNKTQTLGASGRFAKMGSSVVVVYQTMIGVSSRSAAVEVRVEAEGYTIAERSVTVTPGMRVARVDIPLAVSSSPLSVQRLNYPYRW